MHDKDKDSFVKNQIPEHHDLHHLIHPMTRNQYITQTDKSDIMCLGRTILFKHFTSKFCGGANQTQLEVNKGSRPTKGTAWKIQYQSPVRISGNGFCLPVVAFLYKGQATMDGLPSRHRSGGPRARASVTYKVTSNDYCSKKQKEKKWEKTHTHFVGLFSLWAAFNLNVFFLMMPVPSKRR